jgi:nitrite reductase/ring-hydroxylating ferredoxin subunit
MAETCAHVGAPLAEVALIDGSARCPWHGSRYALEDGRVLDGPSAFPSPCFETRLRWAN